MLYRVEVTYPDQHTEEIQDRFESRDEAIRYGHTILAQIGDNEEFHGADEVNEFGFHKKKKPFFVVFKMVEEKSVTVFDSRRPNRYKDK